MEGGSMEIEILSKKENPVIDRIEVQVLAKHQGGPTPKREEIRELVAGAFKVEKDCVVVDHTNSGFGQGETRAYVKVYPSKKRATEVERKPILIRNKLAQAEAKGKKGKEKPPAPTPAPAPAASPEPEEPKE